MSALAKRKAKQSKLILEQEMHYQSLSNVIPHLSTRSTFPEALLKERLLLLQQTNEKFRTNHIELGSDRLEDDDTLPYFQNQVYKNFEQIYENTLDYILERLIIERPAAAASTSTERLGGSRLTKPTISLPVFSGIHTEWIFFRELFKSLVIDDKSLNDIERLQYLMTSLSGEAQIIIKDMALTGNNFQLAWTKLQERYNNNRVLIDDCMRKLRELPEIHSDFLNSLKIMRDTSISVLSALKALGRPVDKWDDWLVSLLSSKLDKLSRQEWEMQINDSTEPLKYEQLEKFLHSRIRALEAISNSNVSKNNNYNNKTQNKQFKTTNVNVHQTNKRSSCPMCKGDHRIYTYKKFQDSSIFERTSFIKKNTLCLNCLGKGHSVSNCLSKGTCKFCGNKHHYLLHQNKTNDVSSSNNNQSNSSSSTIPTELASSLQENVNNHLNHSKENVNTSVLLATARVLIQGENGRQVYVRALLDQGSEASFITENIVQLLRIPRSRETVTISGIGGTSAETVSFSTQFLVKSSIKPEVELKVKALILSKISDYAPKRFALKQDLSHLRNLNLADPSFSTSEHIDLLIGADLYGSILLGEVQHGPPGTPIAQSTIFGWVLSGPFISESKQVHTIKVHHAYDCQINETLQKFWTIEEIPKISPLSLEQKNCEDLFCSSFSRTLEGKYTVRLPLKQSPDELSESRSIAISSLLKLEKRFERQPGLQQKYSEFLSEYESLGHMSKLSKDQIADNSRIYITHHPVLRDSSSTTKLRVVFNASTLTANKKSLNQILHIGPKLQNDLLAILLRWRIPRLVLLADMKKMFRQIWVAKEDRKFQCIVWRKTNNDPIQSYELNTITYGTACAPYLANRVVQQLAKDEGHRFPLAAQVLLNDTYVDDSFFGAEDLTVAKQMRNQILGIMSSAGITMRKWSSNSPDLLSDLNVQDHGLAIKIPFNETDHLTVLGINWYPQEDCFKFQINLSKNEKITKRSMLSCISKLFDPFGWLAPIVIQAKILLQSLWLLKVSWDENLPIDVIQKWNSFSDTLTDIQKISIPRWIHSEKDSQTIELHGFCDASKSAYAAVIYSKLITVSGEVHVNLLISKTKVAPLKNLSIARLELCAASLLTKLICYVTSALTFPKFEKVYCWTDSAIVLCWLQKQPLCWNIFVSNRVSEIQTVLPQAIWRYVPTKENPSDCASRGKTALQLIQFNLWWNGPHWLSLSNKFWPKERFTNIAEIPEMRVITTHHVTELWDLVFKFSSWQKLLRVTVYIFRFINKLRKTNSNSENFTTAEEIQQAANFWVKYSQQLEFTTEIQYLKTNSKLIQKTRLKKLDPFLDESYILRVGGRLRNARLPYNKKFPIILPKGPISKLIITQLHINLLHAGPQLLLGVLREQYWIVGARSEVKSIIHKCVQCTRQNARTETQFMADLPSSRCSPSRAFEHTGVDYAGPFLIRVSTGRAEIYRIRLILPFLSASLLVPSIWSWLMIILLILFFLHLNDLLLDEEFPVTFTVIMELISVAPIKNYLPPLKI